MNTQQQEQPDCVDPRNRSVDLEALELDELGRVIVTRVEAYIRDLEGTRGLPIHEMIVMASERPLLKWAMAKSENNQRSAAQLLGINRNTLHKKLLMHGFLTEKF